MNFRYISKKIGASFLMILVLMGPVLAQDYLSGRVYKGKKGNQSSPISGVPVKLYGSNNATSMGVQISSTSTNGSGWYQLLAAAGYEYYTIVETNLSGYQDVAATSVDGTVLTPNQIRYSVASAPLSDQTLTGNKFWDKLETSPNNPPVADAGGPYTGVVGQPFQIDGTGSYDPDGDPLTYEWDLDGGGYLLLVAQPTCTWGNTYAGNIKLRVTDSHGATDTDLAYVTITSAPAQTGSVQGTKFHDINKNGVQDAGEVGLSGWRIYLDTSQDDHFNTGEPYDYTDQNGSYLISASPGTYDLREETQAGWAASDQEEYTVTIVQNQTVDQDFGNYQAFDEYEFDYGDAPPSYNQAESYTVTTDLFLGESVDADPGPQPHGNALGDDEDGNDDEDGVLFTSAIMPGQTATVQVTVGAANIDEANLLIFLDFNQDGQWNITTETIVYTSVSAKGIYSYSYQVPAAAVNGVTFARAVLYGAGVVYPQSNVPYGEVEDYEVEIGAGGSITVIKEAFPKDNTSFSFYGDLGGFTLQDPFDNTVTIRGMPTDRYKIYETVPSGWMSVSIQVVGDMDGPSEVVDTQDTVYVDYDVGEEITVYFINEKTGEMDFGDAPDPTYPTKLASNGARHIIDPDVFLGMGVEGDPDGQPSLTAQGDDTDGWDDEDGVAFTSTLVPGKTASVKVIASVPGLLYGWIDFQQDGQFDTPADYVFSGQVLSSGPNVLGMAIPASAKTGLTYARFRFSKNVILDSEGLVQDGEVEDYVVEITEAGSGSVTVIKEANPADDTPFMFCSEYSTGFFDLYCGNLQDPSDNKMVFFDPAKLKSVSEGVTQGWILSDIQITGDTDNGSVVSVSACSVAVDYDPGEDIVITFKNVKEGADKYDFGDAPDPNYPTKLASNGARHLIDSTLYLGSSIDGEPDGLTSALANGDNTDGKNDEDGVTLPSIITAGQTVSISVTASASGYLAGWIDFNIDGDWQDQGERIILLENVTAGVNNLTFQVPANVVTGQSYARFRLASSHHISVDGELPDGEVEDYAVAIQDSGTGSLTIVKDATPADDTPFWITTMWQWMGGAVPYMDPSSNTSTITNGPTGVYFIGESVPSGWTLQDIVVTGDADKGSVINLGSHTVNVDLDEGEDITVTFKNEKSDEEGSDYGDAPTGYPDASHNLGGPWLGGPGDAPDSDGSQQYDPQSRGDDQDGNDDEDGITKASFVINKWGEIEYQFTTGSSGDVTVGFWIDFNGDGDWDDTGESFSSTMPKSLPPNQSYSGVLVCSLPAGTKAGFTYMRVRVYEGVGVSVSPTGGGGPGEVEDYEVEIKTEGDLPPQGGLIVGYKFNDLFGDGLWSGGEPPLAGWTIWLDANQNGVEDTGDLYDQTDASGQFVFYGLSSGQYLVGEKLKSGWIQTCPGGSGIQTVTVSAGGFNLPVLFGNHQTESGSGKGALKWDQGPLYDPAGDDTTCFWGFREQSILSESYVADDWFCHDSSAVTSIRWWGSYADWDSLVPPDKAPQYFQIGIWTDVPARLNRGHGHPGEMVREWFIVRNQTQEIPRKSYFVPDVMVKPLTCFQYTFDIPQDSWFYQEDDSTVYWLSIAAVYDTIPDSCQWGWLTREFYFNPDAVRIYQPQEPHPGSQFEEGDSLAAYWDLAFQLGTDEYESNYDFGDAPDEGYGTTLMKNGPHHLIRSDVYLGEGIDADYNGQPHMDAQGDDDDGQDDEDGVEITYPLVVGTNPDFMVTASTHGYLNVWLDIDQDGGWYEEHDHIVQNQELFSGENTVAASVLNNEIEPGERMARFRFSTEPDLWFKGYGINGEVEDYVLMFYGADDVVMNKDQIPFRFQLYDTYPNPFNPSTTIRFDIPIANRVRIIVYNLLGQEIIQLVDRIMEPGSYSVQWDGRDKYGCSVSSGVYICRLITDRYSDTVKLLLMK